MAQVQIAGEEFGSPDAVRATLQVTNSYSLDVIVPELREKPWKFEREVVESPRRALHKELRSYLGDPSGEEVLFQVNFLFCTFSAAATFSQFGQNLQ